MSAAAAARPKTGLPGGADRTFQNSARPGRQAGTCPCALAGTTCAWMHRVVGA